MLGLIRGLCTTLGVTIPYLDILALYAHKGALLLRMQQLPLLTAVPANTDTEVGTLAHNPPTPHQGITLRPCVLCVCHIVYQGAPWSGVVQWSPWSVGGQIETSHEPTPAHTQGHRTTGVTDSHDNNPSLSYHAKMTWCASLSVIGVRGAWWGGGVGGVWGRVGGTRPHPRQLPHTLPSTRKCTQRTHGYKKDDRSRKRSSSC
jgi:hypothetical protein